MSEDTLGSQLLLLARNAIAGALALPLSPLPKESAGDTARLDAPGATFVTLTQQGALRGCIGTLAAGRRALRQDVMENARSAALRDSRFPPLSPEEFETTRVEVSLLSEPEFMAFASETDALSQLVPGIDGIILMHACHRATFLPQVWESLPEPQAFMRQLKKKAGLREDFWSPDILLARYQVQKWQEARP